MAERTTVISCPHCGKEIALDEALSQRIRQELTREIDVELAQRKAALAQAEARIEQEKRNVGSGRKA